MKITQIPVNELPIRLGQFLKMANFVQDGLEAKIYISNGEVKVNGAEETRRGRKLTKGDIVEFQDEKVQLTSPSESL